jgi:hypothetical protein
MTKARISLTDCIAPLSATRFSLSRTRKGEQSFRPRFYVRQSSKSQQHEIQETNTMVMVQRFEMPVGAFNFIEIGDHDRDTDAGRPK